MALITYFMEYRIKLGFQWHELIAIIRFGKRNYNEELFYYND